jgi:hypothetical protein
MGCPALDDGSVEQPLGAWHRQQCGDAHGAGRLPEDGDLAGVPAQGPDVLLHPFECGGDGSHHRSPTVHFRPLFLPLRRLRRPCGLRRGRRAVGRASERGCSSPRRSWRPCASRRSVPGQDGQTTPCSSGDRSPAKHGTPSGFIQTRPSATSICLKTSVLGNLSCWPCDVSVSSGPKAAM